MKLQLPPEMQAALPILERLRREGHDAVFVGGAVRDSLLGLPIKDIDIATSALPEQTMSLFERSIPTGIGHGTITVIYGGVPYEITTYREEAAYEGHRKPKDVMFIADLDGDLLRRDFTINAMAVRADGSLYDPYGGFPDLQSSILRCVGDADARLREDALRMMRAVRFMGAYGLTPTLSAWRAIRNNRSLLRHIAMERVQSELDKMLSSADPQRGFAWLAASGLLPHTKTGMKLPPVIAEDDARPRIANEMAAFQQLSEMDERWAALFISVGMNSAAATKALEALRCSRGRITTVAHIVAIQDWAVELQQEAWDGKAFAAAWQIEALRLGEPAARHWLKVAAVLPPQLSPVPACDISVMEKLLDEMPVKSLKDLKVRGFDLEGCLGRKAGPWMSDMLRRLLIDAATGKLPNEKDKLLRQAAIWNDEVSINES